MFNKKLMTILLCILMIASNLVFSQTIVKATGVAAGVWQQSGGTWNYLNPNGNMITGWISSGGKWYYLKANGAMATGWNLSDSKWYYLNSSGAMITGWILNGGRWYYLNSSGAMTVSKWIQSGAKWYYLSLGGDMAVNTTTPDGFKVDTKGVWIQVVPGVIHASGITLNKINYDLFKGVTDPLIASVLPANATNKDVTWTSSNNAIVTVDNNGKVTAMGAGSANITATTTDGAKPASCIINVTIPATTLSLNKTSANLTVGGIYNLITSVSPITSNNQAVTWTTSNNAIITVDNTGKVTALSPGTAIITVITSDRSKTASCIISVTNIRLNKTIDSLKVGGTDNLIANLFPVAPSNDTVTWTTSNNAIALVSNTGKVTAVSIGIATITAITVDGKYNATCTVTVTEKAHLTFAIDIGHNSAYDTGAVGIRAEDICNKEVGTRVMAKLINLGYNVINTSPTNPTSTTDSLQQRCDAANAANADYYVAIHFNIFNGAVSGSEVYIFSDTFRTKAQQVLNNIVSLGYINRGVKFETYYVLRNTNMPAMLIECSFLDSVSDMDRYNADAFADAIVNGLIAGN